jgi:hypothetical protein
MSAQNIRTVKEDEFESVAEFLSRWHNHSPETWMQRFEIWWKQNPARNCEIPYGWIIEEKNAEILGFIGNIPVSFQISGKKDTAIAGTSWCTKPSARGFTSLKLIQTFTKQNAGRLLLNNTPNEAAQKVFPKYDYHCVQLPHDGMEYWYVRNYDGFLSLLDRQYFTSETLRDVIKGLKYPLKYLSPVIRGIKEWSLPDLKDAGLVFSLCRECGDQYTDLWESHRISDQMTLYRDAETLNWLFFSKNVAEKRHVIACHLEETDELVGYAVFDDLYADEGGGYILQLKDMFVPGMSAQFLLLLIEYSFQLAKETNDDALSLWSVNETMSLLLNRHIRTRRRVSKPYFYKCGDKYNINNIKYYSNSFVPSFIDPDGGLL